MSSRIKEKEDDGPTFLQQEKIRVIGNILDLYLATTIPDNKKPYWYGDVFDNLYDKDLLELKVTLTVYKKTRSKPHL